MLAMLSFLCLTDTIHTNAACRLVLLYQKTPEIHKVKEANCNILEKDKALKTSNETNSTLLKSG